jgi:hypothetical protein
MGEAAMGEAAMGEAAMGEAAMGEAAMGEAAMGEAAALWWRVPDEPLGSRAVAVQIFPLGAMSTAGREGDRPSQAEAKLPGFLRVLVKVLRGWR